MGQLEGAIRADQAQIDNEKLQLVYCRITAPLSGRVGLRLVDQGNMIHATDPNGLVVITQVQPIADLFTLPEDNLPEVIQHMKGGELGVEAYSRDDQTKLATGKLVTIDNQIDPTTGTVRLKAVFDNKRSFALAEPIRQHPLDAGRAQECHGGSFGRHSARNAGLVRLYGDNGQANMQPVKVDLTQGNISLIASGVSAGDQVVVDGQERLQPGAPVEVHSASPNGAPNASGGASPAATGAGGPNGGHKPGAGSGAPAGSGQDSEEQGAPKHGQRESKANESIQAIYSPPSRHVSTDGRDFAGRSGGL